MTQEQEAEPIGYAAVLAVNIGDRSSLTLQFNFAKSASQEAMNAELDKLTAVVARQAARAELPARLNDLKAQQLVEEVIGDDITKMRAMVAKAGEVNVNRRNAVNTQQLEQNITAQEEALKKTRRSIQELTKIVADLEKKAA